MLSKKKCSFQLILTAESMTKATHLKALDSKIPKIFGLTRIAKFISELYSDKYLESFFISGSTTLRSCLQNLEALTLPTSRLTYSLIRKMYNLNRNSISDSLGQYLNHLLSKTYFSCSIKR